MSVLDDEVIVTAAKITIEDILKECNSSMKADKAKEGVTDKEDAIDNPLDIVLEKPSKSTVVGNLDTLQDLTMFWKKGDEMQALFSKFE